MSRYLDLVERVCSEGLHIPINDERQALARESSTRTPVSASRWIHSYVSEGKQTSFCVYDGPNPEAIRQVAERNGCPSTASSR